MREFRMRHGVLFGVGIACLVAAIPVTLLGGGRAFFLPLSGLGRQDIITGDLRPFAVGGGLAGQLRVWDWLCRPWVPISVGLVVCLAGIVPAFLRRRKPDEVSRALAWAWFGASVAIAVCAPVLYGVDLRYLKGDTYPIASLRGVEGITRLQFPDGTQLVEARGSNAMNAGVRAVLLLPKDSVREFLGAAPFVSGVSTSQRPTFAGWLFERSPARWRPDVAEQYLAATDTRPPYEGSYHAAAVADVGDPVVATVYLQWTRPW